MPGLLDAIGAADRGEQIDARGGTRAAIPYTLQQWIFLPLPPIRGLAFSSAHYLDFLVREVGEVSDCSGALTYFSPSQITAIRCFG